jgi:hypothetical protein
MSRDFFKSLLQIARQGNEFAGSPHRRDSLVIGPDKRLQIGLAQSILTPGIIRGFDLDRPQSDDSSTGNNTDLLAVYRRQKPFAEILFRVGNCKCCHDESDFNLVKGYVKSLIDLLIVLNKAQA